MIALDVAAAVAWPLRTDENGAVRVGGTRVTLDSIVWAFDQGESAEQIVCSYPSLQLSDVYGAIFYFLTHPAEVRAYVAERQRQADELQREIEARHPVGELRERLLKRRRELAGPDA